MRPNKLAVPEKRTTHRKQITAHEKFAMINSSMKFFGRTDRIARDSEYGAYARLTIPIKSKRFRGNWYQSLNRLPARSTTTPANAAARPSIHNNLRIIIIEHPVKFIFGLIDLG